MFRRPLLSSPASERVKQLSGLHKRSARKKTGLTLVEGPQALKEALEFAPAALRDVYVQVDANEEPLAPLVALAARALENSPHVHPATASVMAAVAPSAQGIFATLDLAALLQPVALPAPAEIRGQMSLFLPRTQDPGNLGTLIRIADACGFSRVLCAVGGADPFSPKVIRSSAGSVFHLPVHYGSEFSQVVELVEESGGTLVAADAHQALELDQFLDMRLPLIETLVWMLGNEAQGFTAEQLASAHESVKIPMWGRAESLNVSTAAAICLHASATRWHRR